MATLCTGLATVVTNDIYLEMFEIGVATFRIIYTPDNVCEALSSIDTDENGKKWDVCFRVQKIMAAKAGASCAPIQRANVSIKEEPTTKRHRPDTVKVCFGFISPKRCRRKDCMFSQSQKRCGQKGHAMMDCKMNFGNGGPQGKRYNTLATTQPGRGGWNSNLEITKWKVHIRTLMGSHSLTPNDGMA